MTIDSPKSPVVLQKEPSSKSVIHFSKDLNREQYAAVTASDGPLLVIAAAGTGKTRTLVYRVAWLLEQGVDPNRILLLTFTNKAAREMLERAQTLTGNEISGLFGGTFHHLANRLLRRYATHVGFKNDYTILDSDDSKKLLRACADDLGMDKKHFPKPQVLLSIFSVVNGRRSSLTDELIGRFRDTQVDYENVIHVHDEYQQRKKDQNAMDFDDLLLYVLVLFQTSDTVRETYQEQFQYILVDEYQDTNIIQAEWVRLLSEKHKNLMVVGDDFQSIYSWRGANFRNFLDFDKGYPKIQKFKLLTNYRSTPEILDVANAAIAGNPEQFQKELRAVRKNGRSPIFFSPYDGSEQARFIIEQAQMLHRKGIPFAEMCILYRAHFHAMELQMELSRASLPYLVTSGVRFFEQAHIKDVCAVLRLLVNPSDELAFTRLLELFPRVGKKSSIKIFRKLGERVNLQRVETCAQLTALLPSAALKTWKCIEPIFLAYREENLGNDPGELIYRFNKAFYGEFMVENFENSTYRGEDIDGLIDFTSKFKSVEDFLSEIALLTNLEAETHSTFDTASTDSIRLSTIHQAKGLEFKVIFILFLCETMFPSQKAVEESGDSEERRLFYVAVTRAKDHLLLCSPKARRQRDGGIIPLDPSRFVREIPSHLLQMAGKIF